MTVSSIQHWGKAATGKTGAANSTRVPAASAGSIEDLGNLLVRLSGVLQRAGKTMLQN